MEKDLKNAEAIKKMKELAESVRICMYATAGHEMDARPMSTIQVDDDGSIWFFTKDDKKIADESATDDTYLYYSHPGTTTYMTVHGTTALVKDKAKMKELWTPALKGWFPDGLETPDIVLLQITPSEARYWDAPSGKLVVLYAMLKSAITGKVGDDLGEHGELKM